MIRTVKTSLPRAIALILALGGSAAVAAEAPVSVIHCGHLVDVVAGKVLGATTVIVDGIRVREVVAGSGSGAPAGATEIDLSSQTCLPGLIDTHTHLSHETSPTGYTDVFHWNTADYAVNREFHGHCIEEDAGNINHRELTLTVWPLAGHRHFRSARSWARTSRSA